MGTSFAELLGREIEQLKQSGQQVGRDIQNMDSRVGKLEKRVDVMEPYVLKQIRREKYLEIMHPKPMIGRTRERVGGPRF